MKAQSQASTKRQKLAVKRHILTTLDLNGSRETILDTFILFLSGFFRLHESRTSIDGCPDGIRQDRR